MSDANTPSGDAPRDPFEETRRAFDAMPGADAMRGAQAAMGLDPARLGEAFRTMTHSSLEQSREAYGRMRSAADEATRTLEATIDQAHSGSLNLSKRAIEGLRAQAEMNFEHLQKLSTVSSFSEFMEIQTRYLRRQIELATDQARAMQEMTRSAGEDLMRPARDAAKRSDGGENP
ncbi:phasin family protein [Aureimonas jatrophae]|jgi:phasin|uniref:Phasin n=1 Tax=Aureimonas jatrophae TaxID=1166073 RepID=A0A1H0L223_9HYPH|nr:phasin family protein [Aureimonas jatrophae]MBB3952373.1 phasin [Aureimonas jatrophae]SDO62073.1 phasin [Aureimonas jatrophae]